MAIEPAFWTQPVVSLARALIGARFLIDGIGGIIVETEAYDIDDPAAHSFPGPTPRNAPMFGPGGHVYVYRIYGLHWCLNFVGGARHGGAVLIRAIEPTDGIAAMQERRRLVDIRALCSGPGKLAQALGVTGAMTGLPVDQPPFSIEAGEPPREILVGPRIGITKAIDLPWRFGLGGSGYLSRPFPKKIVSRAT
ncbi:DNA-3-methyladenine glycosylase [Sphingomonas sp. MMS24-J13]|uniref:DNA-3-methyladenine glycosylase n=1 Tax=Sphingomonas sp. MMS24-J13 TaxID=3238686 RepID=UPI00384DD422